MFCPACFLSTVLTTPADPGTASTASLFLGSYRAFLPGGRAGPLSHRPGAKIVKGGTSTSSREVADVSVVLLCESSLRGKPEKKTEEKANKEF